MRLHLTTQIKRTWRWWQLLSLWTSGGAVVVGWVDGSTLGFVVVSLNTSMIYLSTATPSPHECSKLIAECPFLVMIRVKHLSNHLTDRCTRQQTFRIYLTKPSQLVFNKTMAIALDLQTLQYKILENVSTRHSNFYTGSSNKRQQFKRSSSSSSSRTFLVCLLQIGHRCITQSTQLRYGNGNREQSTIKLITVHLLSASYHYSILFSSMICTCISNKLC